MAQLRLACPRSRQSGLQQPEKASVWKKRNQVLATGNGTENMGKALNAPVPVCVLLQSCPRAKGRGPSHSHHTIVLGCTLVYPAEVRAHPTPEPKPMSGGILCPGVFLFVSVFLFAFSSCPPSNPSLWQEVGSCWLAEANRPPPVLGVGSVPSERHGSCSGMLGRVGRMLRSKQQCSSQKYFLEQKKWNENKAWKRSTETMKTGLEEDFKSHLA